MLLLVSVHLSWEASRLEEETRTLAEEVGLLRMQVEALTLKTADVSDPSAELTAVTEGDSS